ncbi:MAG: response regulator transcription factor [Verrucomicrobia bacterium]|nr:response regulator transcription factor [Verrucomicrobiota bacterium]
MKKPFDSCTLFKRILLVQNNPQVVAEVHDVLDLHFFEVTAVSSGPEAIQQLLKNDFDAIVCDFTIPNLPAEMFFQATTRIRPRLANRFVAITDAATSKSTRSLGAVSIWKPIEPHILLEAIEGVLKKVESGTRTPQQYAAA